MNPATTACHPAILKVQRMDEPEAFGRAVGGHALAGDDLAARRTTTHLGMPGFPEVAGRTVSTLTADPS